jgi:hypothetical protein
MQMVTLNRLSLGRLVSDTSALYRAARSTNSFSDTEIKKLTALANSEMATLTFKRELNGLSIFASAAHFLRYAFSTT